MNLPWVVGITGASGAPYARKLLQSLLDHDREVHVAISPSGEEVIRQETEVAPGKFSLSGWLNCSAKAAARLHVYSYTDFLTPIASGSFLTAGMIVCPCSGGTLSAVAHGADQNLIQRAASVHLKERRKLILVPRETPLSLPMIENMRAVTLAGATVLPAMPGWYHRPRSLEDLVDFVVARILDQAGIEHGLGRRWQEDDGT